MSKWIFPAIYIPVCAIASTIYFGWQVGIIGTIAAIIGCIIGRMVANYIFHR